MRSKSILVLVVAATMLVCSTALQATVVMDLAAVGNPGNADDNTGYGGVAYEYKIGRYEVTAGQYCEFLNAVARTDTYALYDTFMSSISEGCKIQRSGSSGSYSYSVASDYADRPVNYVTWYDSLRFANWLHNGQPTGGQTAATTEDGAYDMSLGSNVVRKIGATVWLPSEDEWYKAAYHKNDGITGNYFDYPTSSDDMPSNVLTDPDPGNNANFNETDFTIGAPYFRTVVGEFENSESPYGTFDMGGNVWEWNETQIGSERGIRGGSFSKYSNGIHLASSSMYSDYPYVETNYTGFRVAALPDPKPPIADAGTNQIVRDSDGNGSEQVTLDGSNSSDIDSAIVSWIWTDDLGDIIPDGEVVLASLSLGVHTITLTVTDDDDLTDTNTVTIVVTPEFERSPVGRWQGYDDVGDAIDVILNSDGTIEGTWQENIPECSIIWDISSTYTFNLFDGHLTFCFDDTKPCVTNIDLGVSVCIDGYMTNCDYVSGTSSGTGFIYEYGSLVDQFPIANSWQIWRTSVPSKAVNFTPFNAATNQSIDVDLNWSNGGGACTFDIYFGTSNPPTTILCSDSNVLTCDPGPLSYETTYYWRVNSKNTNGTTTGNIQQFTTEVSPNISPVIESVSASPSYILDNQTSSLEVVASDSDGPSLLSYNWIIQPNQGTLDDYDSNSPLYTPPDVTGSNQTFSIMVEVFDGQDVNSSSVDITVIDINSITCDFYEDGFIDFLDFAILADYFAGDNCTEPNWCQGTDVDHSGSTDILELTIFIERWLSEVIDPNLVAYWPMDDNDSTAFVTDISGNGHNGTASANTELLSAPGIVDTCFDFAGTDAVEVNDHAELSFDDSGNNPFSFSAWVFVTSTGNTQMITSKWEVTGAAEWRFKIDGSLQLGLDLWDPSASAGHFILTDDSLMTGWHHVVATYDSTGGANADNGVTLYVDASSVPTNTLKIGTYLAMEDTATKAVIGAYYLSTSLVNYFADKIDNLKIFSKYLTAAEITALYGEGL